MAVIFSIIWWLTMTDKKTEEKQVLEKFAEAATCQGLKAREELRHVVDSPDMSKPYYAICLDGYFDTSPGIMLKPNPHAVRWLARFAEAYDKDQGTDVVSQLNRLYVPREELLLMIERDWHATDWKLPDYIDWAQHFVGPGKPFETSPIRPNYISFPEFVSLPEKLVEIKYITRFEMGTGRETRHQWIVGYGKLNSIPVPIGEPRVFELRPSEFYTQREKPQELKFPRSWENACTEVFPDREEKEYAIVLAAPPEADSYMLGNRKIRAKQTKRGDIKKIEKIFQAVQYYKTS
ncbi:hypothetical protein COV18_05095 [Candidatus Woesearchaeota archaeon CG10_big_fil_rev_8_21_14_0_10_37_12]|nr:MAG: hypothetical protein COV18_05095 [Candidatus Woesearchaeota archaeon CG10_big_fil_rev_8_21_14_0_10_37_12]